MALRRYRDELGMRGAAAHIFMELEHWAGQEGILITEDKDIPDYNTIRNWVQSERSNIGPKYVEIIESYLKDRHPHCLMPVQNDPQAVMQISRYFGQSQKILNEEKDKILGNWITYEPYNDEKKTFVAQKTVISFDTNASQILVNIEVKIEQDVGWQAGRYFSWAGIAILAQDRATIMLREAHPEHGDFCPVNFMSVRCTSKQEISGPRQHDPERIKFVRLTGDQLYGPGVWDAGKRHPVVMLRVENFDGFESAVQATNEMPLKVIEEFERLKILT